MPCCVMLCRAVSCAHTHTKQVFLAMQDRQIALRGKDNWQKDYYMPTPCDGLVIAGLVTLCWLVLSGLLAGPDSRTHVLMHG